MRVQSIHENGDKGVLVTAETSLSNGLPAMILVGFAGKSLDESKERIRSAFSNSSLSLPKKRITVNVSPSDIPKDGAHYDLAIALSILSEAEYIKPLDEDPVVFGELGLDGSIRPVKGILGKVLSAVKLGKTYFVIPEENVEQVSLIQGIKILSVTNLKNTATLLSTDKITEYHELIPPKLKDKPEKNGSVSDFSEVVGQSRAKRALEIAAAGGHNILLNGPPGVGKSMLAKAVPSIMSNPSVDEIITTTHLHSLTGASVTDLITTRPFRSPHHSSSDISIIGGGQKPRPGEISLAHNGVLFLDELPEFKRSTIESLRQPLEDGLVTIARAKDTVSYPADFMLIATKNPCPCGYYGSTKECVCSPIELQRYQKKLSGPILDRIDIHVTVDNIEHKSLLSKKLESENSDTIKKRVAHAQDLQRARSKNLNANMANKDIKAYAEMTSEAKKFIDTAAARLEISARAYMKLVKIARTIADLDSSKSIEKNHIAEAIQYRPIRSI